VPGREKLLAQPERSAFRSLLTIRRSPKQSSDHFSYLLKSSFARSRLLASREQNKVEQAEPGSFGARTEGIRRPQRIHEIWSEGE